MPDFNCNALDPSTFTKGKNTPIKDIINANRNKKLFGKIEVRNPSKSSQKGELTSCNAQNKTNVYSLNCAIGCSDFNKMTSSKEPKTDPKNSFNFNELKRIYNNTDKFFHIKNKLYNQVIYDTKTNTVHETDGTLVRLKKNYCTISCYKENPENQTNCNSCANYVFYDESNNNVSSSDVINNTDIQKKFYKQNNKNEQVTSKGNYIYYESTDTDLKKTSEVLNPTNVKFYKNYFYRI
jgi:hypothetical protein